MEGQNESSFIWYFTTVVRKNVSLKRLTGDEDLGHGPCLSGGGGGWNLYWLSGGTVFLETISESQ